MIIVISFFSVIILLLTFIKIDWGIGAFLLFYFLVPLYALPIGDRFSIGTNLYYFILLGVFYVWLSGKGGIKKMNILLMTPFLFLFLAQAVLIPLHSSEMSIVEQLGALRIDLMSLFLPFVIIGVLFSNKKNRELYVIVLYIAIGVSSLYTLYLLTMIGQNPYIDTIRVWISHSEEWGSQDRIIEEGIRQFGYITSVYKHTTEYGVFLIFSSVFLLNQFGRDQSYVPRVLYGLVLVCVFVCGSRSVLMTEVILVLVFLLQQRRFKWFLWASLLIVVAWIFILYFLPDYMLFISSIRDDSVAGSSIGMRMNQFDGCLDSIQQNPLFGNGYGWTGWYRNTIGHHPVMLSFESCLIQILCNNGLMGIIIWSSFVIMLLRIVNKHFSGNNDIYRTVVLMLVGYFSYTFFTGDYGTFRVMMVFYALIIANEMRQPAQVVTKTQVAGLRYSDSTRH